MIDADGLKARNDADGHQAGDRAIHHLAEVLRATMRSVDQCVRLGVAEWVPGLSPQDVIRRARVRRPASAKVSSRVMTVLAELTRRLRDRGLRLTSQRLAVLAAIEAHPAHPDAVTIARSVRRRVGSISTQSVYNVLDDLTLAGLIRRIEPAGSAARYETRVGDNHHHVVCRSCAATMDVDCVVGHGPCLTPSSKHGFLVDEAEVTFWGLCRPCRRKRRAP